jgi:hypothetical protein
VDHWHPISVRAAPPSAVQRWAQLEAKSTLMREELVLRYEPCRAVRTRPFSNAAIYFEIAGIAIKAWWCIYNG